MNYRMSAEVDLEVEGLKKQAKEAEDAILKLEKRLVALRSNKLQLTDPELLAKNNRAIRQTTLELNAKRVALKSVNAEIRNNTQVLKTAGTAQQQFRSQVGSSNAVALEFNRIIQDAPFGIIGIGNNIQQLTANFAQLRAGSASTGAALKASLLSIVSPANLVLLGVSAITSLWTAYQLGAFGSAEATEDLKTESELLAESLDRMQKALSSVTSARLKGTKNAQEELVELELLKNIIEDTSKPLNDRTLAYEKLQGIYPKILNNISTEKALAGGLSDAYGLITAAILERATAIAIEDKIVEFAKQRIDLLQKEQNETTFQIAKLKERADLEKKQAEALAIIRDKESKQVERNDALRAYSDASGALKVLNEELVLFNQISSSTENEISKNNAELEKLKTSYSSLSIELQNLLTPLKDAEKEQKQFYGGVEITRKNVSDLVTELEGYYAVLQLIKTQNFEEIITPPITSISRGSQEQEFQRNMDRSNAMKQLGDETKKTTLEIQKLYATEALGGNPFAFLIDSIFKFQEVKGSLDDFADGSVEKMNLLREQAVLTGNIFSGLGDTFASVFASGNRELGQFISALGDFIGQLVVFAKASQQASALVVGAKQAEATAAAVSAGAQTAASKGPAGFYLLAPLIASAVALVGSAFRGLGGARNTGGRSSATSSASLNSVGSSITGFGSTANPFGDLTLRTSIRGTDIELLLERVTTKARA